MFAHSFTAAASSLVARLVRPTMLTCVAMTLLTASLAQIFSAQTLELTTPAPTVSEPVYGDQFTVPDLPAPNWQEQPGGVPVARLRFRAADAVAWRLEFRSLALGQRAQMFLYGIDAAGGVRAVHGPYEKNGPDGDGLGSRILEGAELVIEVRGELNRVHWPFEIHLIERLDAPQLEAFKGRGFQVDSVYRPAKAQEPAGEVRSTWFDDELVLYKVVEGQAIAEGDIVLGAADEVESGSGAKRGKQDFLHYAHEDAAASRRWPKGVIPYTIDPGMWGSGIVPGTRRYDSLDAAINVWNKTFPGILVRRTNEPDYVTFTHDPSGPCRAQLGRVGGQQRIWIKDDCLKHNIVHEIGHALGMWHEHQRPDRDQWVTILWQNIEPKYKYAFELPNSGQTRMLGAYDYGSVMHYARQRASVNGEDTIVPKQSVTIGDRSWPSEGDQTAIQVRYCNPYVWSMPNVIYAGPDGGTYSFTVVAPPYCTWTISESASKLTVSGALTRTGTSTVTFSLPSSFQGYTADITINSTRSDTVRVIQEAENIRF